MLTCRKENSDEAFKIIAFYRNFFIGKLPSQSWHCAVADLLNGRIAVRVIEAPVNSPTHRNVLEQMPGWPKSFPVNQYFKPFRGVALSDLDNDDTLKVIASSASQITVFNYDGSERWTRSVTSYAQYCPSVADVNNDGWPEIVQFTRGAASGGRIYLLDRVGNDLPGWQVSPSTSNFSYQSPWLADSNSDGKLEIIVGTSGNVPIMAVYDFADRI